MSLDSMQACSATDEECTQARDWSQLPRAALTHLMLLAGQSARHGKHSCALVCSSWADAVDAAAHELDVFRCASTDSLQGWLIKHGQHLEKLRLHSVRGLSVLPCPQLQHLELYNCEFDLTVDSSAFCSSISTATALTSLHINKCRLMVDNDDLHRKFNICVPDTHLLLMALAPLTALQELSVCGVTAMCDGDGHPPANLPLNINVLQPLQRLTQLHLQVQTSRAWGPEGDLRKGQKRLLQHVGSMTDLQDLQLGCNYNRWENGYLDLAVAPLTSLTKLRKLGLFGVDLTIGPRTEPESGANVVALLAWVARLQGLSSLQLRSVAGLVPICPDDPDYWDMRGLGPAPPGYLQLWPPSTAYSALTASSALQHIDLLYADISQKGAWQHAFPRDDWSPASTLEGKFTNITSLRFGAHLDGFHAPALYRPVGYFMQSVAGSCPNLQELQACDFEDMEPFQHHTSLTRLTLSMKYAECEVNVRGLVKLTQLKSLQLLRLTSRNLRDALHGLARQTTLTHLALGGVAESDNTHSYRHMRNALDSIAGVADPYVVPRTRQFVDADSNFGLYKIVDADSTFGLYTIVSKAPPGSPSNLPSQLQAVLDRIAQSEHDDEREQQQRKQNFAQNLALGERLFPLVQAQQPELAGKITGMLQELDDSEVLVLLDNQEALDAKVEEAIEVLKQQNAFLAEPAAAE